VGDVAVVGCTGVHLRWDIVHTIMHAVAVAFYARAFVNVFVLSFCLECVLAGRGGIGGSPSGAVALSSRPIL
jgi:hypothetical protein